MIYFIHVIIILGQLKEEIYNIKLLNWNFMIRYITDFCSSDFFKSLFCVSLTFSLYILFWLIKLLLLSKHVKKCIICNENWKRSFFSRTEWFPCRMRRRTSSATTGCLRGDVFPHEQVLLSVRQTESPGPEVSTQRKNCHLTPWEQSRRHPE